jgi:hypothetical protein
LLNTELEAARQRFHNRCLQLVARDLERIALCGTRIQPLSSTNAVGLIAIIRAISRSHATCRR